MWISERVNVFFIFRKALTVWITRIWNFMNINQSVLYSKPTRAQRICLYILLHWRQTSVCSTQKSKSLRCESFLNQSRIHSICLEMSVRVEYEYDWELWDMSRIYNWRFQLSFMEILLWFVIGISILEWKWRFVMI